MRAAFRIPPPDESVPRWHVSPLVDAVSYHWSWAWVLIPTLFMGQSKEDYLLIFLLVLGFNFSHRHLTMPYTYADSQVFAANRWRFVVFPGIMLALFIAAPALWTGVAPAGLWTQGGLVVAATSGGVAAWIYRHLVRDAPAGPALVTLTLALAAMVAALMSWGPPIVSAGAALVAVVVASLEVAPNARIGQAVAALLALGGLGAALSLTDVWPSRPLRLKQVIVVLATVAAMWNIWHVYMQKYGILRLYNAKSGVAPERRAPGWSDRLLILAWVPLYFVYLGPAHRETIHKYFRSGRSTMDPMLDGMAAAQPIALPLAIGLVVFALVMFVRYEWRASRLRNPARLGMALGTTAVSGAFLVFDPVKVYLAFAFSHALEYSVFVWAFQRKRYSRPLTHKPLLARMLRWPVTFYVLVLVGTGAVYIGMKYWGRYFGEDRIVLAGLSGSRWMFFWAIFQSMVHFYFDGFLWKMRLPSVRENV